MTTTRSLRRIYSDLAPASQIADPQHSVSTVWVYPRKLSYPLTIEESLEPSTASQNSLS